MVAAGLVLGVGIGLGTLLNGGDAGPVPPKAAKRLTRKASPAPPPTPEQRTAFTEALNTDETTGHKERNVCDLLPERDRDQVRARIRAAWSLTEPELATQRLELLASERDRTWPDAAGSLREGLGDALTLMRLGITGKLAHTLGSTNPCESMIEIVRSTQRNAKRWQDGDMRKRWTAAGMLVAEQQFRRIIG
jgi:Transposase, Mutator family